MDEQVMVKQAIYWASPKNRALSEKLLREWFFSWTDAEPKITRPIPAKYEGGAERLGFDGFKREGVVRCNRSEYEALLDHSDINPMVVSKYNPYEACEMSRRSIDNWIKSR